MPSSEAEPRADDALVGSVLAERYRIDADETSTAIVLTTALSIPTLGFLLVMLSG